MNWKTNEYLLNNKNAMKKYINRNVLDMSRERIAYTFDNFDRVYISFSWGKDSTVMTHLVLAEAKKRNRKVWLLIIDLEAQYDDTINHIEKMTEMYKDNIDLHWFCWELLLRNALSSFEPKWCCWDSSKKDEWVRKMPEKAADLTQYDFYTPWMEFEEMMVLFWERYSQGKLTWWFIGIRSDESLHRYSAIVSPKIGKMYWSKKRTTKVSDNLFNIYPIYDWKTADIWIFHGKNKDLPYNNVYEKMQKAWVPLWDQRLCQPYWDDQKKGIWLYQILEPNTRHRLLQRVSWVNSGALYIKERGSITGSSYIDKPEWYNWEKYCNFLLSTLPPKTMKNYKDRFKIFIAWWKKRWYKKIPDEAPHDLETQSRAPSRKRMCRSILRNDYYCKWLWQTQPKSEAYLKYKQIKFLNKQKEELKKNNNYLSS